jgi:hypothetical protein
MIHVSPAVWAVLVGLIHFYFNPSCDTVQFTGVFPYPTGTQFILPALAAMDPDIFSGYYANGSMPPVKTFPFSFNTDCLANCGEAATELP